MNKNNLSNQQLNNLQDLFEEVSDRQLMDFGNILNACWMPSVMILKAFVDHLEIKQSLLLFSEILVPNLRKSTSGNQLRQR